MARLLVPLNGRKIERESRFSTIESGSSQRKTRNSSKYSEWNFPASVSSFFNLFYDKDEENEETTKDSAKDQDSDQNTGESVKESDQNTGESAKESDQNTGESAKESDQNTGESVKESDKTMDPAEDAGNREESRVENSQESRPYEAPLEIAASKSLLKKGSDQPKLQSVQVGQRTPKNGAANILTLEKIPNILQEIPPETVVVTQYSGFRKSKDPWTLDELEQLARGLMKHGDGKWMKILRDPEYPLLKKRDAGQLKDKWRNTSNYQPRGSRSTQM